MTSSLRSGRHLLGCLLWVVASCAVQAPAAKREGAIDPRVLYPLKSGNAWSYDVDTGAARTTLAVTKVESFDGRVAQVRTGSSVVRYDVDAQGIRIASGDAWLLRAPLREGATWPARGGRMARLGSTRVEVTTDAGEFEGCVEVIETGGDLELEVRTVYCPGVGPVSVQSTMRSKVGERSLVVSARLRGYRVNPEVSAR